MRCAKCNAIDTAHACGYRLPPSLRVKTSQRVSYQLLRRRFDRSLAINLYIHLENELKGFVLIHLAVPTKGTHVCKHACTHKHPTQYTVSTYVRTQRPISCAASSCLMTQMSCAKRCTATSFQMEARSYGITEFRHKQCTCLCQLRQKRQRRAYDSVGRPCPASCVSCFCENVSARPMRFGHKRDAFGKDGQQHRQN